MHGNKVHTVQFFNCSKTMHDVCMLQIIICAMLLIDSIMQGAAPKV